VIGNPPYGVSIKGEERKYLVDNLSKVPDYEIYYWFIDKARQILKQSGVVSYIIPNSILFNVFAQPYRLDLFNQWSLDEILDCTDINIFEDATVRNIIFLFVKTSKQSDFLVYKSSKGILDFKEFETRKKISVGKQIVALNNQNWGLIFKLEEEVLRLIAKLKSEKESLSNLFPETSQGLIAYDKYKGQSKEIIKSRAYHHFENSHGIYKKWLYGEDVKRYSIRWNEKEYIDYCEGIANPRDSKYFIGKRILIREITNPRIYAAITSDELYHDPAVIVIKENPQSYSLEALLAILNSKLATFFHFNSSPKATKGAFPKILVYDVNNFPLPLKIDSKIDERLKNMVIGMVDSPISSMDHEIDKLVYKLYNLTDEEIRIIENFT
jgi:adenine-specific DNA-methyltransferase